MQLFPSAATVKLGDGSTTLFWENRWLGGARIQDLALKIYARVPPRKRASMIVSRAVHEGSWPLDIDPSMDVDTLREYFDLRHSIAVVQLHRETPKELRWAWEKW